MASTRAVAGTGGAVLLAAVVGGGAFAYTQLSGGGPQPADVLPADAQAYVRLDLDPSAGQKIDLFRLLNKVPEIGDALGIDDPDRSDIRELAFEAIAPECPDVDYDDDIEPWIGDRIGAAGNLDDEEFVIAVQVKDEDAADDGIADLFACSGEDYGIAFHEGYALIAPTQGMVDDALDGARAEPLSESEAFSKAMDELGEQGVASLWVDAPALAESVPELLGSDVVFDEDEFGEVAPVAAALRVDGSAIELAAVSAEGESVGTEARPLGELPSDTVVAMSFAGVGDAFGEAWEQFLSAFEEFSAFGEATLPPVDDEYGEQFEGEFGELEDLDPFGDVPTPEEIVDGIEAETGLVLPDDLETLLSEQVTLSVGGSNLETVPTMAGPGDLEQIDVALAANGDGVAAVLQKLADFAAGFDVPLVVEQIDGGAALATNRDAAQALGEDGDLGGSDSFERVMPFADDPVQAVFVDVGAILQALLDADPPEDIRSGIEEVDAIDAVGISGGNVDGMSRFSLRVSFTD